MMLLLKSISTVLGNTPLILSLAIVSGLLTPYPANNMEFLLMPALIFALTLSLRTIPLKTSLSENLSTSFRGYALNLMIGLSALAVAFAFSLKQDAVNGFIVLAFVPPAIAVIPFTHLLGGDRRFSLSVIILAYILSIIITPLGIWVFTEGVVDPVYMLKITLLLIGVPVLASRLLPYFSLPYEIIDRPAINLSFFAITYILLSVNHQTIYGDTSLVFPVLFILFFRTFATGILAKRIIGKMTDPSRAISYMLFASYKNAGAAAVLSFELFGEQAAIPAALSTSFEIGFMIYAQKAFKIR